MRVRQPRTLLTLIAGFAIGVSVTMLQGAPATEPPVPEEVIPWQDARVLAEVLDRVHQDYVDPVDDHKLLQNAIRGMVGGLDPHSAYLDDEQYDEMKITTNGSRMPFATWERRMMGTCCSSLRKTTANMPRKIRLV